MPAGADELRDTGRGPAQSVDQGLVRDRPALVPLVTYFVGSVALPTAGSQMVPRAVRRGRPGSFGRKTAQQQP